MTIFTVRTEEGAIDLPIAMGSNLDLFHSPSQFLVGVIHLIDAPMQLRTGVPAVYCPVYDLPRPGPRRGSVVGAFGMHADSCFLASLLAC